ncbi:S-adenosyl-L-methionine-dependent methyltransferase [Phanerochaete sordida]|uniref:Protein-lysine N-methyltransferase EFM4 n=1 Tax=Phanerochaete sordida TaxID=48140 RepID=A0A9P3G5F5_9APHY|nr:S-adenosyl-L-methionine-dependent methyltransferase [Phanerochaete sordida]
MSSTSELNPSKLGTKQHWDNVYAAELTNFEDIGDEGEIWFGEDSIEKMLDWVQDYASNDPAPFILEVGAGNGTLLFALHEAGYDDNRILGVDYSEDAVKLARAIGERRGEGCENITFETCDFLNDVPAPLPDMDQPEWDIVLDKGTFDAIALAEKDSEGRSPADGYPLRIGQVVRPGGYFLITSCNFTEDELKAKFGAPETGLKYHSRVPWPTFSFGGQSGNVYSTVAFQKPAQS